MVRKKRKRSEAFQRQNLIILILLIIMFVITVALYFALDIPSKTPVDTTTVTFENHKTIDVEIAKSIKELQTGLMYRDSLPEDHGMLFIFWDEQPLSFWMKNTLIPLDIIFVDKNYTIVNVIKNMQPCEKDPCQTYDSGKPALYAIEVNSGFASDNDIKTGQKVFIENG